MTTLAKLELILKDFKEDAKKKIIDFAAMCDDLENLITRENTILLDKGTIVFDGMFIRKINMLKKFERDIRDVLYLIKEGSPDNLRLQNLIVQKIQDVRRTLSINTTFQLSDLKKRTQRMAVLKDTLLDFSENNEEGENICH